ncbi:MAG: hypothetical protein Q8L48_03310 [Archangium sp.]|nr:hypothetical protein [Archangium sp.]
MEPRPPPKGIALQVIGMLALLPGAVMHSFALGEATRLGSDWVYLSTPLLVLGAASFAWLLQRKLGTPGLAVGALISLVALGAAGVNLQRTITERVRWRASSRALSDTDRFCEGQVKPNSNALSYVEGAANPTVFFKTGTSGHAESTYETELEVFRPGEYQVEKAALVACMVEKRTIVETCNGYIGGGVAERERVDVQVKVFSIKTGAVVFEKSFEGEAPRACANTEKFYGKSLHLTISGERPAQPRVLATLSSVLKPSK